MKLLLDAGADINARMVTDAPRTGRVQRCRDCRRSMPVVADAPARCRARRLFHIRPRFTAQPSEATRQS